MSEESVAIAALDRRVEKVEDKLEPLQRLEAAKHTHGNKLQEHSGKLDEIGGKMGTMEREVAVVQSEVEGLRGTVTTGFTDLKDVIVHRAEQDAEERKRQHELAVTAASDSRALWMKALGLVATALTIAGGGGGILYSMSADESPHPHHEAQESAP
jgi:chromosome condensin MukBEF ATPase and DNA-binding subunit MukB